MAHTPGPWNADFTERYITARDVDGNAFIVAEVSDYILEGDKICNVNLISAAPELLESCLRVIHQFENINDDLWPTNGMRMAVISCREAVTKAEVG